jgi:pyruvate dehydrogenase E1 component
MIQRWVGGNFIVLGTDGFGRSDDRLELRKFFEVDTNSIVLATVSALEREGTLKEGFTTEIVEKFRISRERFDKTF